MTMLTAAEIGAELTRFVQGPVDSPAAQAYIQDAVATMLATPGHSGVDVLAFVALSANLTRMAIARSADGMGDEARYVLALAAVLQRQAVDTLETLTGMAGDGFSMEARRVN